MEPKNYNTLYILSIYKQYKAQKGLWEQDWAAERIFKLKEMFLLNYLKMY